MGSFGILGSGLTVLTLAAAPVFAQGDDAAEAGAESTVEAGEAGAEPAGETNTESSLEEPEVEDSAILPSSENYDDSAAPTMALDCEKRPDDCTDPLTGTSEGPELSTGDAIGTTEVESEATAPVTAEPPD